MTSFNPACPASAAPRPSLRRRLLEAVIRHYRWPVLVSRELVDRAWLDVGLGRLDRHTLEDIGAPPWEVTKAEEREAWRTLGALDRTRRM